MKKIIYIKPYTEEWYTHLTQEQQTKTKEKIKTGKECQICASIKNTHNYIPLHIQQKKNKLPLARLCVDCKRMQEVLQGCKFLFYT